MQQKLPLAVRIQAACTMVRVQLRGTRVLPFLVACALCAVWPSSLFSLPKKAEPRLPIKPRNAMRTLERDLPVAEPTDEPSQISTDDENRMRLNAGLPGDNVVALTSEADLAEMLERVTKTGQLLVVDYYAPWCRACQKLLRYMHKIAREPDFRNVEFATVDFDRSEDLVKSRKVDRLPTLEIYHGKDLKQRWSGANTKKFLERLETENQSG